MTKRWTSFQEIADWTSAMIPRIMKSFGIETWFPLKYQMTNDLEPDVLGKFDIDWDEDAKCFYGTIFVSADLIAKKDILAVVLHELFHAHCVSRHTKQLLEKQITKSEFRALVEKEYEHEGLFGDLCREAGFGKQMKANQAKPALIKRLLALDFE